MRRPRLDPTRSLRAGADVLAIAAFVYLGQLRHGTDPVAEPLIYLDATAPFVAGWLAVTVAGLALGVELWGPAADVRRSVALGAALWVPACLIGLALRASPAFHGNAPPAFALVALSGGALAVASARAAAALALRSRPSRSG